MSKKKTKLYNEGPQMSMFHHKHGTSMGIVPAGEDPEKYWAEADDFDKNNEEEDVESSPLPMPYAEAVNLLNGSKMLVEFVDGIMSQLGHVACDVGLLNDALITLRPAIKRAEEK